MAKGRRSSRKDASDGSFADAVESMGDVEPLDRTNLSDLPPPPDSDGSPHGSSRTTDPAIATEALPPAPASASDTIVSVRATRTEMRRLRAGKIRPQQTVDLHGFTRDEAYARLCNATARAAAAGKRCVLVVHGRGHHSSDGSSVLKNALPDWIARPPLANQVIGCCFAQPRDGGSGASYLLLR
ncbi:MAG: Smr/MutS family protein [Deltaproteobacteria bacterium]|nr:Smr/MutS family protein [Deltaproteobacteria bacterium]MBW2723567.1 Smr/MutS family protein [Deltaproteobacteria bacterium]